MKVLYICVDIRLCLQFVVIHVEDVDFILDYKIVVVLLSKSLNVRHFAFYGTLLVPCEWRKMKIVINI